VRDWRIGHLIGCLTGRAEQAGIVTMLVDERGHLFHLPGLPQARP
jgi:hypothetical protein